MKKNLPIIAGVVFFILLIVGGFIWWRGRGTKEAEIPSLQEPEGVLIETSLKERPYVILTPRADGREFTLQIFRIKNAQKIEYELVYLTKGLSRGVIGSINLEGESQISRKLLLGTCSRGVCKYDENVTEGTLTLRFRGSDGVRKFVSDFHLQQGEEELTSLDDKFRLKGKLSSEIFYLTMSTIGLPEEIEGELVSGPYGAFITGSEVVRNGKVTLVLSEEKPSVKLYAWDSRNWEEVKGVEIKEKTITAEVENLGTFITVASE